MFFKFCVEIAQLVEHEGFDSLRVLGSSPSLNDKSDEGQKTLVSSVKFMSGRRIFHSAVKPQP